MATVSPVCKPAFIEQSGEQAKPGVDDGLS